MPIYEYQCGQCKETFEILQRPDEKVRCPSCGSRKLRKLLSSFSCPTVTAGLKGCADESSSCSAERCRSGACPMGES